MADPKYERIRKQLIVAESEGEEGYVKNFLEDMLMRCVRPEHLHERGFETTELNGTPAIYYKLENGSTYQWYELPNGEYRFWEHYKAETKK